MYVLGSASAWGNDAAETEALARARWVVTVAEWEVKRSEGGRGPGARPPGHEPVSDGAALLWAPREDCLEDAPSVAHGEVARLLSGMNAGLSPRCKSDWEAPGGPGNGSVLRGWKKIQKSKQKCCLWPRRRCPTSSAVGGGWSAVWREN